MRWAWREPDTGAEALELDALQFGSLVHGMLDAALPTIEAAGRAGRRDAGPGGGGGACGPGPGRRPVGGGGRGAARAAVDAHARPGGADGGGGSGLASARPAAAAAAIAEVAFGDPAAAGASEPWEARQPVVIPGRRSASGAGSTGWTCPPTASGHGWWTTRPESRVIPEVLILAAASCNGACTPTSCSPPSARPCRSRPRCCIPRGDGAYHPLAGHAGLAGHAHGRPDGGPRQPAGRARADRARHGRQLRRPGLRLAGQPRRHDRAQARGGRHALLGPAASIWDEA